MLKSNEIGFPLFAEISKREYPGKGFLNLTGKELEVEILLTLTASRAFVTFQLPHIFFDITGGFTFAGELTDGRSLSLEGYGNIHMNNEVVHAECFELKIGNEPEISSIETTLLGFYFMHEISFEFGQQTVTVFKSTHDLNLAYRTNLISGAILEGSRIRVEGDNLDIKTTNDLLRDICFLLRIISSSQVYFSHLTINDGQSIIYDKDSLLGKLFGFRENVLYSTFGLVDYLKNGLVNFRSMNPDDRQTIIITGFDLSVSAASGLMETELMTLISSLERLGNIARSKEPQKFRDQSKCLHKLRSHLNEKLNEYVAQCGNMFSEVEKANLIKSVSKLQHWDTNFIQGIKAHLQENGWDVVLDFKTLKTVRDSLAHSGMLPKGLTTEKWHELTQQLEDFLLIHALDLLGVRMLVAAGQDGWTTYLKPEKIKIGQNRSEL